jgi:uncharacterized membrane protein (UPF0127 family)
MGIRSLFSKRRFVQANGREEASKFIVRNRTRSVTVADLAEAGHTSAQRRKGLLGRQTLAAGEGLWIVPCESVHTCGMKFPIDLIYLDRRQRVRKIRTSVVPWRLSMCLLAHSVLELPAGTIDRTDTRPGDQLELSLLSENSPPGNRENRQRSDTKAIEV